jgi:hypothetical protein
MGLAGSRAITAAMVLLCYGGSADAKAAIDHAGALLKGSPAVVLSVWEPFIGVMTRAGLGMAYGALAFDADEVDAASERGAAALAEEGTERAREVGLDAHPRARQPRADRREVTPARERLACGAAARRSPGRRGAVARGDRGPSSAPSRSSLSAHLSRCGRRRRSCEIVASWPLTPS